MNQLAEWLSTTTGIGGPYSIKIVYSVAVVLFLWAVRTLLLRVVWRRTDDVKSRYFWRKTTSYIGVIAGILIVGRIWLTGFSDFMTFAGLVSAGVAIALKDTLANIAGWVFIIWRRPFVPGDRVQIGDIRGDVIDVRVFQFSLLEVGNWVEADQSTGRVLHIPNSLVMTTPMANYGTGFEYIWHEMPVLVTFESDWKKAKEILTETANEIVPNLSDAVAKAVRETSKRFMIFYQTFTPTVYTSVDESGVLLTIRYMCRPRERRGTSHEMWERILDRFAAEPDIEFAYPTERRYMRSVEMESATAGSPGTAGEDGPGER